MFALAPSTNTTQKPKHLTPNLIPCTIHHNGPIQTSSRYWSPQSSQSNEPDGAEKTAYFRGRKLQGRTVKLPKGYVGVVVQKTDAVVDNETKPKIPTADELRAMEEGEGMDEDDADGLGKEEAVEVKRLEQTAEFDEMVIWGHEAFPEADDVYVRGVEEWVGFAEAMHCEGLPDGKARTNGTAAT